MKAMILAAGLGRRLSPITNSIPKALVEINGKPLLEIIISKLIGFGFNDLIINVHHFSDKIIDFLGSRNNFGINIIVSDESDLLLDTGGGLKKASSFFNDGKPFLVHNVDVLSNIDLSQLYKFHLHDNPLATLACQERNSTREFLVNSRNELCGWKNNKTGEVKICNESNTYLKPMAFCGIQIISPKIFNLITETGVFSIIDLYLRLSINHPIKLHPFNNATWLDIGSPDNLKKASQIVRKMIV
jgi:N-acetyl-alpha-D-muramate 1-phosphate uridylyltransferase